MLEVFMFAAAAGAFFLGISLIEAKCLAGVAPGAEQTFPEPKEEVFSVNQFLQQLRQDVEAGLFPRPTDSVLSRHYDAMVAVHLEDRLSIMPN